MADDIRVKFDADASSYNRQLKDLAQQNKTLKSELDKVKSSTDENTTAQEKAAKIAEAVQKQVKGQEEYIKALKAEYDKLSQAEGDNTTALMKQEEKINKAETALNKMNEELADAQREADGYANEAKDASKQTEEMDEAARLLAASKLAEFYDKVSEAVQKVATAAYDAAKELDEGYDTIIKKTGATGDALGDLQSSADNVFGRLPAEMSDVGTAIGEVNTRFGLTGNELEDVSELFLKFANITDSDVNNAIGTTSRLLKTYGGNISDADEVLGYFAKQSQQTGIDTNTLLASLDKNGATLREMGLDLQQSTKLLALFEENGVDSAGAMTGLRKAVINGAKAGKSFDQVISEASDSIANAATDAEALEIATELFGTKGAVVMADGLRSGRISLKNLTESMSTYGRVVGDTFEATLNPWDKAKVAMNNLKIAGSELAGEALATIAPLLDKVVSGVQSAVKWFKDLPEPVRKVVAVVGMLGAGVGVAFPKVQSLMNTLSMFKAANAIKGLTGAAQATEGLATGATKAGGAFALMSSPIAVATTAIAGVGLALAGLAKHTEAAIEAEYGLTEEQKNAISAINDAHDAYVNLAQARADSLAAAGAEFGHIEELKDEYNSLIDANGRVKQGYESRAQYILGELSNATGITIEQLQNEAKEYGYLGQSIDQVIEKKRLEAMTSAYMESYTAALQNVKAAQDDYTAAVEIAAQREEEYLKVVADTQAYADQRQAIEDQMAVLDPYSEAYTQLAQSLASLDEQHLEDAAALQVSKKAYDDATTAVDNAWETYNGYQETIAHYEGAQAAIMSGEEKQVRKALSRLQGNYSEAEKKTKTELEKIVRDAETNLAKTAAAVNSGKMEKAALREAQAAVASARSQLASFRGIGADIDSGLAEGMDRNKAIMTNKASEIGLLSVDKVAEYAQTHSPSRATLQTGKDIDEGLKQGLDANKGAVGTAAKGVANEAVGKITSLGSDGSNRSAGQKATEALKAGLDAGKGAVQTSANAVSTAAKSGLATDHRATIQAAAGRNAEALKAGMDAKRKLVGDAATAIASEQKKANVAQGTSQAWGSDMVKGLASGISGSVSKVTDASNKVKAATNSMKGTGNAYSWGAELASAYAAGISSKNDAIRRASIKLANSASSALHFSLPDVGPLREIGKWGPELAQAYAEGMASDKSLKAIEQASLAMANVVTPSLSFGADGINGKAVSNSYTQGDTTVNVYAKDGQSAHEVALEVEKVLSNKYMRERMAWA